MSKKNGGPQKQYEEGYFDPEHPGRLVVREVKGGDYNWGTGGNQVVEKGSQQQQKVYTSGFQTESNPNASESKSFKPSTTTSSSTSKGDSSKKPGGTLSYKDSYTDAVASKWESKGGYAAYEKAAKAWNKKKYGTTEPTSTAKAGGIAKKKLASKHKVDSTKFTESLTIDGKKTDVKDLGPEYTSYGVMAPKPSATSKYTSVNKPHRPNTSNNTSLANTIAATNSDESLLGGVRARREKRQADRRVNRENREANRIRHAGDKAVEKRANKERRQDNRQERADERFKKRTGIDMSGTPAKSQSKSVKKKKSSGEGWGKSGVIERF